MKKLILKKEKKVKNNNLIKILLKKETKNNYKKKQVFIKKNNNNLINVLIKSKNMFGDNFNKVTKDIIPFIFGIRYKNSIINLNIISIFLKRIYFLIKIYLLKNKNILIIGNSLDIKFLFNNNFIKKNKNIFIFNKKWINGLISNKKILKKKNIKLIIIFKSSFNEKYLNKELYNLKIPIISLINIKQKIKNINYPIIYNSNNIKSLYTLMFLIRNNF